MHNENDLINQFAKLREYPEASRTLTDRVMADIESRPVKFRRLHGSTLHMSKSRLTAMMCVAAGVFVIVIGWQLIEHNALDDSTSADATVAPVVNPVVTAITNSELVRFVIVQPTAQHVSIAGSFNSWEPTATPLTRVDSKGTWTVELPLGTGRHTYMFVINGKEWVSDPNASQDVVSEFGTLNSVVTVAAPLAAADMEVEVL